MKPLRNGAAAVRSVVNQRDDLGGLIWRRYSPSLIAGASFEDGPVAGAPQVPAAGRRVVACAVSLPSTLACDDLADFPEEGPDSPDAASSLAVPLRPQAALAPAA